MSKVITVKSRRDLIDMEKAFISKKIVACDTETNSLRMSELLLEGIGVGTSNLQYYIPFPNKLEMGDIREVLGSIFVTNEVIFHNAKFDLQVFNRYGIAWPEKIQDTMIMSWLIDENVSHGLKPLSKSILGRDPASWKEIDRNISLFRTEEDIVEDLAKYCGEDVKNTYDLYVEFADGVRELGLWDEYKKIEIPTILMLTRMEMRGIKLSVGATRKKKAKAQRELDELSKKMRKMANKPAMNIASPLQLEEYLFDELKYPVIKATKGGSRSTDSSVLNELIEVKELDEKSFVAMLLKYRDLDKIKSTYYAGLLEEADKEGVIHASFLQHGTRTGRFSSSNPNLQNIPRRDDEWNVRELFIPRPKHRFIIADYSQAELRMLAHLSKDPHMMEIFKSGGDIHKRTMEITGTDRRGAKSINFGIVYGVGPRTLASQLGSSEQEAKDYMKKFFLGYPKIKPFITRIQHNALSRGYVTMITGRRRRFYEMKDLKYFGSIQRQAINTKIQGSASDLIKIAMLKLERNLKPLDAYQLVQIHDEVLIEVPEKKMKECKKVIKDTMEGAMELSVPLVVSMVEGDHWIKG